MARGRKPNLDLELTPSLRTQRAFRERKRRYQNDLEDRCKRLEEENRQLKASLEETTGPSGLVEASSSKTSIGSLGEVQSNASIGSTPSNATSFSASPSTSVSLPPAFFTGATATAATGQQHPQQQLMTEQGLEVQISMLQAQLSAIRNSSRPSSQSSAAGSASGLSSHSRQSANDFIMASLSAMGHNDQHRQEQYDSYQQRLSMAHGTPSAYLDSLFAGPSYTELSVGKSFPIHMPSGSRQNQHDATTSYLAGESDQSQSPIFQYGRQHEQQLQHALTSTRPSPHSRGMGGAGSEMLQLDLSTLKPPTETISDRRSRAKLARRKGAEDAFSLCCKDYLVGADCSREACPNYEALKAMLPPDRLSQAPETAQ